MSFGDWIPTSAYHGLPALAFYDTDYPLVVIINTSAEKHFNDPRNPFRNLSVQDQREIIADMCYYTYYGVQKTDEPEYEDSRLYNTQYFDEESNIWYEGELGIEKKTTVHVQGYPYKALFVFHAMIPLTPEFVESIEGHRQSGGMIYEGSITDELFG